MPASSDPPLADICLRVFGQRPDTLMRFASLTHQEVTYTAWGLEVRGLHSLNTDTSS